MSAHLLEIKNLKKVYPIYEGIKGFISPRKYMCAVEDMSFYIDEGETYGLVGESGCGKSTTGRMIVGLAKPDGGAVVYKGQEISKISEKEFWPLRNELQMVFQNSLSAMNPRRRAGDILDEILAVHGIKDYARRREQVLDTFKKVGLSEEHYFRFPHELSGGQVQRLGIASALIISPRLVVCDEPVSALDVSIQAQILNMLMDLKKEFRISLLFISHDIGVVRFISDRIGVMYLGALVEEADTETLFQRPCHPYTRALFAAVPDPYIQSETFQALEGEQPVRTEEFAGCAFRMRCPYADSKCAKIKPEFKEAEPGHRVACHYIR